MTFFFRTSIAIMVILFALCLNGDRAQSAERVQFDSARYQVGPL